MESVTSWSFVAPFPYNHLALILLSQTIKCLLIVPNPESALDEEAGKLLLEDYQEYYKVRQVDRN